MTFTHTAEVRLEIKRCHKCGQFYAVEQLSAHECPYCHSDYQQSLELENARLKRSNAALRGHRGKESGHD